MFVHQKCFQNFPASSLFLLDVLYKRCKVCHFLSGLFYTRKTKIMYRNKLSLILNYSKNPQTILRYSLSIREFTSSQMLGYCEHCFICIKMLFFNFPCNFVPLWRSFWTANTTFMSSHLSVNCCHYLTPLLCFMFILCTLKEVNIG